MCYPMVVIHFSPLKSGQPLYSGQISWSQCVLYREVSLYIFSGLCVCVCVCVCARTGFFLFIE